MTLAESLFEIQFRLESMKPDIKQQLENNNNPDKEHSYMILVYQYANASFEAVKDKLLNDFIYLNSSEFVRKYSNL